MMKKIACLFAAVCLAAAASAGCAPEAPSEGGEYYTVAFDSRGGTAVESQRVLSGNPVRRPETPVREGYYLDGWFTDADAAADACGCVPDRPAPEFVPRRIRFPLFQPF